MVSSTQNKKKKKNIQNINGFRKEWEPLPNSLLTKDIKTIIKWKKHDMLS